ncbi:uncharacterized protein LOC131149128 [Malania oleifera]|uniref:uncharacterized protein LOC131149128 n=1 Tax=Malania oleifera TaxID=397392 RepID=UPI0025ADD7C2|nr:uncharacterized protein LOC131149128 [Malania oleifera]
MHARKPPAPQKPSTASGLPLSSYKHHSRLIHFFNPQNLLEYSIHYQSQICLIVLFHRVLRSSKTMSSASRAWMVAATVGAVEALKDQGFCRWNYALRSIAQRANHDFRSFAQARKQSSSSSSSSAMVSNNKRLKREERGKQSEESLRQVMYLSCWGPN